MWQKLRTLHARKVLLGLSWLELGGIGVAALIAFLVFSPARQPTLAEYVAEHPDAKVFDKGLVTLSGIEANCNNLPIVFDTSFPDDAGAWQQSGFIAVNPSTLFKREKVQQVFTFYHECGHMNGIDDEQEADCYSIRAGVKAGWIDAAGIETLCRFWRPLRGDNTHASGPERCAEMQRCFAEATRK
jgi:hypothetical protein